eukprot:gene4992-3587_t
MYSDGNKKTVSELKREAQATRRSIAQEAKQVEELKKGTAKLQFFIDQLFRFFAPGVESEEDKRALVEIIVSNPPEIYLSRLPLLPIATMMANGKLTNTQRIFAADNPRVDDPALIFFIHVLRFSPQAAQVLYVDISRTAVTARGLFYFVEAMVERGKKFTLEARELVSVPAGANSSTTGSTLPHRGLEDDPYLPRLMSMLEVADGKKYCTIYLEPAKIIPFFFVFHRAVRHSMCWCTLFLTKHTNEHVDPLPIIVTAALSQTRYLRIVCTPSSIPNAQLPFLKLCKRKR